MLIVSSVFALKYITLTFVIPDHKSYLTIQLFLHINLSYNDPSISTAFCICLHFSSVENSSIYFLLE